MIQNLPIFKIYIMFNYVYVCVWVYACECRFPWKTEEGIGFLEMGYRWL